MKKLWGVINKEILVLFRDLPALLLIIISITEDRVNNHNRMSILLIAPDTSQIKRDIFEELDKSEFFKITTISAEDSLAVKTAKHDISKGNYQAGIFISSNAYQIINRRAEQLVALSSSFPNNLKDSLNNKTQTAAIDVIFDPAMKETFKYPVINALKGIFTRIEINVIIEKYFANLESNINNQLQFKIDSLKQGNISAGIPNSPYKKEIQTQIKRSIENMSGREIVLKVPEFPWQSESIISLEEGVANEGESLFIEPSVSQSCVPGFILFSMFFIVLPLAGTIVTERHEGAYNRLRTLPVSYLTLMFGKIIVYGVVCMMQFLFMMLIGLYVLSGFFDIPALVMGNHYFAIVFTALMSSLAAIGFGLLVGSLAKTHAQASSFGSFMVIILSIFGGVFIPLYLLPSNIKIITMISPLRWGIDAFINLFVRNEGLFSVLPNLVFLFLFFILSLIFTLYRFNKKI